MINEAIILAGGLGTRLQSVLSDKPKCMAPIHGKPFLSFLVDYLQASGIEKFIFSVGYMHDVVEKYLDENYSSLHFQIALESEPLGTGGAIKLACSIGSGKNIIVCNGDTLFKIGTGELSTFHIKNKAACSLCLKPMENFDRYGVVTLKSDYSIQSFQEKKYYDSGLINGGVYALNVEKFLNEDLPEKFSFEKDYLEKKTDQRGKLFGLVQDRYFIDIGIPEDLKRAQDEF